MALAAAVAVAVAVAVAMLDPSDEPATPDDPESAAPPRPVIVAPDPSVFGGPAARRLPDEAIQLWSAEVETHGDHWIDAVRRDVVIVATANRPTADGASAAATLTALDAATGGQRWTVGVDALPGDVKVVGAVDDVLVLAGTSDAFGVDLATGETRWEVAATPEARHVGLVGTPFVARERPNGGVVTLIDATSGSVVGEIATDDGTTDGWITDRMGIWYAVDGGDVIAHDLRNGDVGSPTVVAALADPSAPRIVVDDRMVMIDDSGAVGVVGAEGVDPLTVALDLPPARSLHAVAAGELVVTTPDLIAGASVGDDDLRVNWVRETGAVVDEHPVDGGLLLQVASRGGASMELVDGRSGQTIEGLTMMPGALSALTVTGDGVVVVRSSDLGPVLAGLGLDGRVRWSIAGAAPAVVGDGIVVRGIEVDATDDDASTGSTGQLVVTAYGAVE